MEKVVKKECNLHARDLQSTYTDKYDKKELLSSRISIKNVLICSYFLFISHRP